MAGRLVMAKSGQDVAIYQGGHILLGHPGEGLGGFFLGPAPCYPAHGIKTELTQLGLGEYSEKPQRPRGRLSAQGGVEVESSKTMQAVVAYETTKDVSRVERAVKVKDCQDHFLAHLMVYSYSV